MTTKIKDQVKQLNKIKKNKTIIMDCKKKKIANITKIHLLHQLRTK
jgi:hypothetical protein